MKAPSFSKCSYRKHNIFILETEDLRSKKIFKIFYSDPKLIFEGLNKPNCKYTLAFSTFRFDAKDFMKYLKIHQANPATFDGWYSSRLLQGTIEFVGNKDYNRFIQAYNIHNFGFEFGPKFNFGGDSEAEYDDRCNRSMMRSAAIRNSRESKIY